MRSTASRPFSAAGVNGRIARCRPMTSCDHVRLQAHRQTSSLSNALILKAVKGETKWIEAICYR